MAGISKGAGLSSFPPKNSTVLIKAMVLYACVNISFVLIQKVFRNIVVLPPF